jgi:DNA replication licensing factor MCM3
MAGILEPVLRDDLLRDRARRFQEFLDDTTKRTFNHDYGHDIEELLANDETRLIVNLDDIRDYNSESRELADGCAGSPWLLC